MFFNGTFQCLNQVPIRNLHENLAIRNGTTDTRCNTSKQLLIIVEELRGMIQCYCTALCQRDYSPDVLPTRNEY